MGSFSLEPSSTEMLLLLTITVKERISTLCDFSRFA
jgi:hypothetical protein